MDMTNLITLYLDTKKLAWSKTTLLSEKARLKALLAADVLTGNAAHLWDHVSKNHKPYSRLTAFTRAASFWSWLISEGHKSGINPYDDFKQKNARLFKHVYQPKTPKIGFKEAATKINSIRNSRDRELALQILGSGERFFESIQESPNVVGKGNKSRLTFRPNGSNKSYNRSYSSFRRSLQSVGLKPHDLRKLCATQLVRAGMKEADLMRVMGWSSILTAKAYLQPKTDDEIRELFKLQVHKELT